MRTNQLFGGILVLLLSNFGYGQCDQKKCQCKSKHSEDNKLLFNFENKTLSNYESLNLSKGDLYQVEIKEINQNVYRIILNESDTILTKPIDYSAFSMLDPTKLTSLLEGITNTVSFSTINNTSNTLDPKNLSSNLIHLELLNPKQKSEYDTIVNVYKRISTQTNNIAELHKEFTKLYDSTLTQLKHAKLLGFKEEINYEMILSFEKSADKTREESKESISESETKIKNLIEVIDNILKTTTNPELHGNYKKLKESLDKISTSLSKLKDECSKENIDKIIAQYVDVINNSSRTYTSLPFQYNGDNSKLKIKIEPIDSASRLPTYSSEYFLPKPNLFYLSVGPGLYYSNLSDDKFSTRGIQINDSTKNYQMVPENLSNKEIGLSVLIRSGSKLRCCPMIGFHATLGAGLSFTKPARIRALYGGGFSIGKIHSINFDILGTSGYVDIQSSSVNENMLFTEAPSSYTVSKLRTKIGFSIGYTYTF